MATSQSRRSLVLVVVALFAFVLGGATVWAVTIGSSRLELRSGYAQSHRQQVYADITSIKMGLDSYAMQNHGEYPSTLAPLAMPDKDGRRYIGRLEVPRDPWNREYVYVPSNPLNVLTYVRDGVPGGVGEDADIDTASIATGR